MPLWFCNLFSFFFLDDLDLGQNRKWANISLTVDLRLLIWYKDQDLNLIEKFKTSGPPKALSPFKI